MSRLEQRLTALAHARGADLVGLTSRARLADAPPSADPGYLLPSARSVVAFAVALDPRISDDFLGKRDWLTHCTERKAIAQRLYGVGDALVTLLRDEGHEAINVDLNCTYRPEPGAGDITEYTEFHPDFSHRYAALAAGLGRLGWSGNLLTPRFGALVELGSVITSAALTPDPVIADADHPCAGCKLCSLVCPVEMIHRKESLTVTVAGVTERIARKRPNTCCWIGCSGYQGLSTDGRWSNWSPYRIDRPLPRDKTALDALCTRLQRADPQTQQEGGSLTDYRRAVFDPDWTYHTVCGFCRGVCRPDRRERVARRRLIVDSGTAALGRDGSHVLAGDDAVELDTPHQVRVVVSAADLAGADAGPAPDHSAPDRSAPGHAPMDRAVLSFLRRRRD